jgi:chromosome segregation ATPase
MDDQTRPIELAPVHEYPTSATPASPPATMPPNASAQVAPTAEWRPTPAHQSVPKARRWRRAFTWLALIALFGTTVAGGVVAYHENQVSAQWRVSDLTEVARNLSLTKQLNDARSNISTLNGHVADLNTQISGLNNQITGLTGQVSTLNGQIAQVASQKEKAIDANTVLSQLLHAAGVVATRLQTCVSLTNTFYADVNNAESAGAFNLDFASLQTEANNANAVCNSAEQANQQLQALISANS